MEVIHTESISSSVKSSRASEKITFTFGEKLTDFVELHRVIVVEGGIDKFFIPFDIVEMLLSQL